MKSIFTLIKHDLTIEFRQKHALSSIFLFAVSAVFLCYLALQLISDPLVWIALYWLIILFASVNIAQHSFLKQSEKRFLYYYTLVKPNQLIVAKILLNGFLILSIAVICLFCFALFFGFPFHQFSVFVLTAIGGSFSISAIITLMSAISAKAKGNTALVSILSFPLLVPVFITVIKLSKIATENTTVELVKFFTILIALIIVVFALAYLLFAYLWRD